MRGSWFKRYQPKTLEEYVFENNKMKQTVIDWVDNGFINGNLLLFGPPGTGKTALADLVIRSIIKTQQDVQRIKSRHVNVIDDLEKWLNKKPIKSKIKIVYLEEFDKLSKEAKSQLKDGLMENYQEHVSFICTTNHINIIEHALQTRFTHKFNLICQNKPGVTRRLKEILDAEQIEYNIEELAQFVEKNITIGLRDLVNTLQVNTTPDKKIDIASVILQRTDQENVIAEQVLNILRQLLSSRDPSAKRLCLINPTNSEISPFYTTIIETVQYQNIDYTSIFEHLEKEITFLPIKIIINKYESQLDNKRMPHIHFLAFLAEAMQSILDINL